MDTRGSTNIFLLVGFLVLLGVFCLAIWILSILGGEDLGVQFEHGQASSVGVKMLPRPSSRPGAISWFHGVLIKYCDASPESAESCREIIGGRVNPETRSSFEALIDDVANRLHKAVAAARKSNVPEVTENGTRGSLEFRTVEVRSVEIPNINRAIVVDRFVDNPGFVPKAEKILLECSKMGQMTDLEKHFDKAGFAHATVARFYILAPQGTFLSMPLSKSASEEANEFARSSRTAPTFASDKFLFQFEFRDKTNEELSKERAYSGLYLDLGGLGVVASVFVPFCITESSCDPAIDPLGVLALDLQLDLEVNRLRNAMGRLSHGVVDDDSTHGANGLLGESGLFAKTGKATGQNWSAVRQAAESATTYEDDGIVLTAEVDGELTPWEKGVDFLHRWLDWPSAPSNKQTLTALRLSDTKWLVFLVRPHRPLDLTLVNALSALGIAIVLVSLVWGRIDHLRQEEERRKIFATMGIPLVTVDASTDEILHVDQKSSTLPLKKGNNIQDHVLYDDPINKQFYADAQVTTESRRAYVIEVQRPDSETGRQYALIRSAKVEGKIRSLNAKSGNRLATIIPMEKSDVDLLRRILERRLASLFDHGQLPLISRVLEDGLSARPHDLNLSRLARYLRRRMDVIHWIFLRIGEQEEREETEGAKATATQHKVTRKDFEETLALLRDLFESMRGDLKSRGKMQWKDCVLTNDPVEFPDLFEVTIDWPEMYYVETPKAGLLGFAVGELLVNAIRHGAPRTVPRLDVTCSAGPEPKLTLTVENRLKEGKGYVHRDETGYHGLSLVRRIAKWCGWTLKTPDAGEDGWSGASTYKVTLEIPLRESGAD